MRSLIRPSALVETWFDMLPAAHASLARGVKDAIVRAEPRLVPTVKWGNLVFLFERVNAMALVNQRQSVELQVFNGQALAAQFPELKGDGRNMRALRLKAGLPLDAAWIADLTLACMDDILSPPAA